MDMHCYFVEDTETKQIYFNVIGVECFRVCFAKIGIRLDQIRTGSQFDRAIELLFEHESRYINHCEECLNEFLLDDDFDDEGEFGD